MEGAYRIGRRVYLRPPEVTDVPAMVRWMNNPDVTRTLRVWRPMGSGAEREWIERASKAPDEVVCVIVSREDDRPIGTCGLMRIDWVGRSAGFGIGIGEPDAWGKGYGSDATELMVELAFGTLNLNRMWLEVFAGHDPARHVYEKCGFRLEGTQREAAYKDGAYLDVHLMAVLRADWEKTRS
jgi:RimJ/RimL family protein N-acetyltransferase